MPLRDDLLNPIEGENPSGPNLRFSPVYDKIKEARRVEDDAPQGDWQRERKVGDYKTVVKLAGETLATKTKDLQLAAWLTEAMFFMEGFAGLKQGLDLSRSLLENFWDTIHPEIEDDDVELRAVPLDWVGGGKDVVGQVRKTPITKGGYGYYAYKDSRAVGYEEDAAQSEQKRVQRETAIAEGKPTAEEFDQDSAITPTAKYEEWVAAMDGCLESIESLGELCGAKFGSYAPSFSPLRTAVEEVRHVANQILQKRPDRKGNLSEPEPEAEVEADSGWSTAPDTESSAAAAPAAPARKKGTLSLEPVDLDDVSERLAAVAKFLREQDSYSPGPYLLLRGYRWGEMRGYGESPDPRLLIPPPSEIRQKIRGLSLESNWQELLETGETAMAQPFGRAWLDLQRYVVKAAEEQGYAAIAAAVRSELRALLQDLPQLPHWTLMDDTPAANAETQAWLREITAAAAPPAAAPVMESRSYHDEEEVPQADLGGAPPPPDTYTLALDAARSGRLSEALQMLSDEVARQQSGRARFHRKLQLAQICMMTGHEGLAQPILEELVAAIDSHHLEEWELPATVADPLALMYRCLHKLGDEAGSKQKLYSRISRLDPVQALECLR